MKSIAAALMASLLGAGAASTVTPVQKVIELLEGMSVKGKKEKHEEQVQFAAYKQFCDDTTVEKQRAIKEAAETIEVLKADIAKCTADAAKLTKEIAAHDADIAAWTGDKNAATKVRQIERADYEALHQDYSESVDALQRAIAVMKKQSHDRPQGALVQVDKLKSLTLIPNAAKQAIAAFVQQSSDPLDVTAPEAYGYELQSHGIIDMLEKLLDTFIEKRTQLEKEEMNTKHAFEMLIQDLTAQVDQATTDRGEKAKIKAKKLQAKAQANSDLRDTTTTKEADLQKMKEKYNLN